MITIFCDGSSKIKQECIVTSLIVVRLIEKYNPSNLEIKNSFATTETIVNEIIYCAKKTYNTYFLESIHELLAMIDALEVIEHLNIKEKCIIVSDSVEMIKNIKKYQETKQWNGKQEHIKYLDLLLPLLNQENIQFEWQPRTTLGLNVADFLNKEPENWTNNKDKPFLTSQMKKLLKKDYRYNISK